MARTIEMKKENVNKKSNKIKRMKRNNRRTVGQLLQSNIRICQMENSDIRLNKLNFTVERMNGDMFMVIE